MKFRSLSWGEANLSWSVVMEEILHATEEMGHEAVFLSTNGTSGMKYFGGNRAHQALLIERQMRQAKEAFDVDITFTVPANFHQRFLSNSRVKMAIYDYESSIMPPTWRQHYKLVDFVLPASTYVADMFRRNGCPEDKIAVTPHGIDLKYFNPNIEPMALPTAKKFKFLAVAAPHYRKQLDRLLNIYCERFSAADDVCLILKTTTFQNASTIKPFEMDLRPTVINLTKRYGKHMPEIRFISGHIDDIASLYTACQAFVLPTASEGYGIPFLESLACGVPVIAPRHGGQLDYLNDQNALLADTGIRLARPQEQYWGISSGATVGAPDEQHFGELMQKMHLDYINIKSRLLKPMAETASNLTWQSAALKIIKLAMATGRTI